MQERTVYAITMAPHTWLGQPPSKGKYRRTTWKFWTGFDDEFSGFRLAAFGSYSVMSDIAEKLKKKKGIESSAIYLWEVQIKYPDDADKPE